MSKNKEIETGLIGYSDTYYENILTDSFLTLRGKLLNLADASASSVEQRKAMKGLIRDFTRAQYEHLVKEMTVFLTSKGVLKDSENCSPMPSLDWLEGQVIKEI